LEKPSAETPSYYLAEEKASRVPADAVLWLERLLASFQVCLINQRTDLRTPAEFVMITSNKLTDCIKPWSAFSYSAF